MVTPMLESSVITSSFRAGGCAGLASGRRSRNYHCASIAIGTRQFPDTRTPSRCRAIPCAILLQAHGRQYSHGSSTVEQGAHNASVAGSIPACATTHMSVSRSGSASVSKTESLSSILSTFANTAAALPTAPVCQPRVSLHERAANSPRLSVLARAGGFPPIWHDARSPTLRRGATDACHAGVFLDTTQTAAFGVRALHEQTGGRA